MTPTRPDPQAEAVEENDVVKRLNDDFLRGEITFWNVLPDAATEIESLRAKLASARKALEEGILLLELVERPRFVDPDYGKEVKALGDRIGYGALMSSASASWRDVLKKLGHEGGEFVAGPCQASVTQVLTILRAAEASEVSDDR